MTSSKIDSVSILENGLVDHVRNDEGKSILQLTIIQSLQLLLSLLQLFKVFKCHQIRS